jgi:phosphoenolpyruvate carboxylase
LEEPRFVVPKTMSSQHPDNASTPPWDTNSEVISGEGEIREVYEAFKSGCQESMWDAEGKDVDPHVIRKLLLAYPDFFREKIIGKDVFITYRVPNPRVEIAERKVLIETLVSIPESYDVAEIFYTRNFLKENRLTPIFEVILPLTTSSSELFNIVNLYRRLISLSKQELEEGGCSSVHSSKTAFENSKEEKSWLGTFHPEKIDIIPLFEDYDSIFDCATIIEEYINKISPTYMRVFIARSDPALNYGLIPAVLIAKVGLSECRKVSQRQGIEVFPIIGVGSLPFRGHLSPDNVENFVNEYKGAHTVTIQSAFKYDYPKNESINGIEYLNNHLSNENIQEIDEGKKAQMKRIVEKIAVYYGQIVEEFSPVINKVATFVPVRRARKLHIGLFGYARKVGRASLPRAIPFTAAMYTLGIPPEFIGLNILSEHLSNQEQNLVHENYRNFKRDLSVAGSFVSWQNINMISSDDEVADELGKEVVRRVIPRLIEGLSAAESNFGIKLGPRNLTQRKYENVINSFLIALAQRSVQEAKEYLTEAARLRRSLG